MSKPVKILIKKSQICVCGGGLYFYSDLGILPRGGKNMRYWAQKKQYFFFKREQ